MLLYHVFPFYYTLNNSKWNRRKIGKNVEGHSGIKFGTTGRLYTVHPNENERFHLRVLLHVKCGPTSWESLKEIDGEICRTYIEKRV